MTRPLYKWGSGSRRNMVGVHPHLITVLNRFINITLIDAVVTCGARTRERQEQLVKEGKSKTMNSRHLPRIPMLGSTEPVSHAVNVVPYIGPSETNTGVGHIPWEDIDAFKAVSSYMFKAAYLEGVPIEWGGHFCKVTAGELESFFDGPHYQLPWSCYPVKNFMDNVA